MTQPSPTHPGLPKEFAEIVTNVAGPYHEPPKVVLRRRIVVAVGLVAGATVLGFMLRDRPGQPTFASLAFALAAIWVVGAVASGPLHLGCVRFRGRNERPVFTGTGLGLGLGVVFVLGALAAREIPWVADQVRRVLHFADHGSWELVVLITLVNAIAEEMFFRGSLYTAFGRHSPAVWSTLLYIVAMLATGNVMLGFAALLVGAVCAVERRATGGVLAPVLTHLVWGLTMVLALPSLFGGV